MKRERPNDLSVLMNEDEAVLAFPIPEGAEGLTESESQVLLLILAGASNGAIAKQRATSVRTVANQVASILQKLGASSRTEIIVHIASLMMKAQPAGKSAKRARAKK